MIDVGKLPEAPGPKLSDICCVWALLSAVGAVLSSSAGSMEQCVVQEVLWQPQIDCSSCLPLLEASPLRLT